MADFDLVPVLDVNFRQDAFIKRLHLHGGFVGFDLGKDIPDRDVVPYLLDPPDQRSFSHGVTEFRHFNGDRHRNKRLADIEDFRDDPCGIR